MVRHNKPTSTGGDDQEEILLSKDRVQIVIKRKQPKTQSPVTPKSQSHTRKL